MIRIWFGFAVLFAVFYFGIPAFRHLNGLERLDLTKTVLFSMLCAILAVGSILLFVALF